MKIFNFERKEKLDIHLDIKFGGKYDGDSPEAQKSYQGPVCGPY